MDEIFGTEELNQTTEASISDLPHTYNANDIALMLGALGACVASIICGFKNVKKSSCCLVINDALVNNQTNVTDLKKSSCCLGLIKIEQRTELPVSKDSIILESHV